MDSHTDPEKSGNEERRNESTSQTIGIKNGKDENDEQDGFDRLNEKLKQEKEEMTNDLRTKEAREESSERSLDL